MLNCLPFSTLPGVSLAGLVEIQGGSLVVLPLMFCFWGVLLDLFIPCQGEVDS